MPLFRFDLSSVLFFFFPLQNSVVRNQRTFIFWYYGSCDWAFSDPIVKIGWMHDNLSIFAVLHLLGVSMRHLCRVHVDASLSALDGINAHKVGIPFLSHRGDCMHEEVYLWTYMQKLIAIFVFSFCVLFLYWNSFSLNVHAGTGPRVDRYSCSNGTIARLGT